MYELISRQEANNKGLTRYFTGKDCKHGHICQRKVNSGVCVECSILCTRKWRQNGSYNPEFKTKPLPSIEYLNECFSLINGALYWKQRPLHHFSSIKSCNIFNGRSAGKVAGHYNKVHKYLEVRFDNKLYKGHRIIYKMYYGYESDMIIDHIDGDVTNNNPLNLRPASIQENARNSEKRNRKGTSTYKGVAYLDGYWYSCVTVNDTSIVNKFKTEIEAAKDYNERVVLLFGEFAKLNQVVEI